MVGNHYVWMNLNPSTKHKIPAVNMGTQHMPEAPLDHLLAAMDLFLAIHWQTALCSVLTERSMTKIQEMSHLIPWEMGVRPFKMRKRRVQYSTTAFAQVSPSNSEQHAGDGKEQPRRCTQKLSLSEDFVAFEDSFTHSREIYFCGLWQKAYPCPLLEVF